MWQVDQDDVDHIAAKVVLAAQSALEALSCVKNLTFENLTALFPIEHMFIETVSQLCPGVDHIRVWHHECLTNEDIEDIYEELHQVLLPPGVSFLIDWNGEP